MSDSSLPSRAETHTRAHTHTKKKKKHAHSLFDGKMIKSMLNKISSGASTRDATKPQDIKKENIPGKNNNNNAASANFSSGGASTSPKSFAEKFAMSLDDVSFVDGEDAYGDAPFMREAMVHRPSPRNSLDVNVDATKAKRDEELTIYGFSKEPTKKSGEGGSSSVRSSFDDFFYGSRVPKAEDGGEHQKTTNVRENFRRAASLDYPHPQWEHKMIRELHRKELARDHPEAKFRSEK